MQQKIRQILEKLWLIIQPYWSKVEQKVQPYWFKFQRTFNHMKWKLFGKSARSRTANSRMSEERKRLRMLQLVRIGAVGSVIAVVAGIFLFFALFAYYSKDLPKPGEVVRRDGFSTKIYDRQGELLYDLFDEERRTPITIEDVPESLKQATIAVEDKDFYKHKGFDMLTIFRIPYNYLVRGRLVGGSTLTQQLVKNALLTNERSIQRKFKELVLSLQIERTFTKDEILEMYLNEAPYGGTAWGVGTASEVYFNKSVSELNTVESAILAGLPQRPSAYSPYTGKNDEDGTPLWKVRALGVLRRMKEDGYLTDLTYEQAIADLDTVEFEKGNVSIKAPHFVFYVRDQLAEMYGEDVVEQSGFKVTTSLNYQLQETAQNIVQEEISEVESLNITNGSAMVVDPRNGEILTMVGSRDFNSEDIDGQFNVAVDGLRQPGSSIKPVTYLALFQQGYGPASMLVDVETEFATDENADAYQPKNYDGQFRGPVSVRNSLGSSLNITAVKALAIVGVDRFLQLAYDMGFETLEPTQENFRRFGLAVTLGGAEVHLIDTVTAYSSFANGGTKVEPISILKVEDRNGKVIFEQKPVKGKQVFSEGEAFLINNILSDNNARAIAFGTNSLLNVSPNVAVKTGTTNDQRDNWAIGWSQEVMVGAWVGNNDNSAMKQVASGVSGATPIWRRIMLAALDLEEYGSPEWQVPDSVEQVVVDSISGYPEHDEFPSKRDYYIKGALPSLPDPIHAKLEVCDNGEKLATDARIARGDYEEKEFIVLREDDPVSQDGRNRWQEAINAWIEGQTDERFKVPTEYCGEENEIYVDLKRPKDETSYDEEEIEIEVESDSGDGIEKIEIIVNGSVRETVNDRRYKGKIKLSKGRYEVYAKAYSKSGETKNSNKVEIGTGGEDWEEPDPTPTPKPNSTPSPTPTPLVISTPTISPAP